MTIAGNYYQPTATDVWTGRIDGTEADTLRWHQWIRLVNLQAPLPPLLRGQQGVVLLGFACDEGVRRNKGRTGAAQGPMALRKACAGFPAHFNEGIQFLDGGNIVCTDNNLEAAQDALSEAVQHILAAGYLPIVLGGGHEITYGHARGIYRHLQQQGGMPQLGLINFDAHFDLRIPGDDGPNSGTSFWQLAQDCLQQTHPFRYLALGIQAHSNTAQLFRIAAETGVIYLPADAFHSQDRNTLRTAINACLEQVEHIYLTIDLDVFAAPFAPGVSATAFNGIMPGGVFMECFRIILQSGKVAGIDIAELNPALDIDNRTAKLGAALMFEVVMRQAR
ncbi:formimidoylglutamase [Chitinophaga agrisoli]|uniref:Formimidoylglutamase n=1 Tax=Chitinophaga agrisoli TaxID=2607653 RepID=A0A5B2VUT4_9BACT|nr:formimidoylglutamase [Chitinophaga agrisoli]KAA2241956.1 formimidoylglutamase [Chitinophaga agrisoli]